jgi:UDP-N-acetyl-D-mannosaminouronate:lipid I N-acetyl-D-mannosaminouronosyltransferase
MNIFVTVGHTHYNSLFKAVNEQLNNREYTVVNQISDGDYLPNNHEYFTFTQKVDEYIDQADIVITHAGAGSVYHLLELGKAIVVVPNFDRVDEHQKDLADFVSFNNYATVCRDLSTLADCVIDAKNKLFTPYRTNPFSGYEHIISTLQPFCSQQKQLVKKSETIAGISVNLFQSMNDALSAIVSSKGAIIPGSAIAINPEKIIKAREDVSVKDILLSASFRFADGIGVVKTLSRKTGQKITRIPGCELWEALMKKAGQQQLSVFLIGAKPSVISQTKDLLISKYQVNVCGMQDGYFNIDEEELLIQRLVELKPDIVSIALGSPRQEVLINRCRTVCPDTFFMGVGGTYDVFTNNVKRAPKAFIALNLEWFYRLASQPTRGSRQLNLLKYLCLELTRKL